MTTFSLRRRRLLGMFAISAALLGCATPERRTERELLAPAGVLRVAVYPGSPTSLVERVPPESMKGVTVDLGRALAAELRVPAEIIVYERLAEALAALQKGEADFTITNATHERVRLVDFAPDLVDLELGILIHSDSRINSVEQLDLGDITIGVSQGSSSERALGGRFKRTKLRAFPNLEAAQHALRTGEIDGFATNKGILYEMAGRVPGSKVLEGRWGTEHLAPAIPKGRMAAMAYLESFAREARDNGALDNAIKRAGLRGTVSPSQ